MSRRRRLLLVTLALVFLTPTSPAQAHADILATSPSAGAKVGGTVDRVELLFEEAVDNYVLTIEDPSGTLLESAPEQVTDEVIALNFAPLRESGQYIVRVDFVASDGDVQQTALAFSYDPALPPPVPIDIPDEGRQRLALLAIGVAGGGLLFIGGRLWHIRRHGRVEAV